MDAMAEVVKAVEDAGIHDRVKVIVGGAPVSEEFCKKIGADAYAPDAASAADKVIELCRNE
jgi:methanogenic corrinoid protein MtbC1